MELRGKKTLVVGLARTGVALARFLAEAGARVTVTDQTPATELADRLRELTGNWGSPGLPGQRFMTLSF